MTDAQKSETGRTLTGVCHLSHCPWLSPGDNHEAWAACDVLTGSWGECNLIHFLDVYLPTIEQSLQVLSLFGPKNSSSVVVHPISKSICSFLVPKFTGGRAFTAETSRSRVPESPRVQTLMKQWWCLFRTVSPRAMKRGPRGEGTGVRQRSPPTEGHGSRQTHRAVCKQRSHVTNKTLGAALWGHHGAGFLSRPRPSILQNRL